MTPPAPTTDPATLAVGDRVRIVQAVRIGDSRPWMRHLAGCCGTITTITQYDAGEQQSLLAKVLLDPESPRQRLPREVPLTLRHWYDGRPVDVVERIEAAAT